MHKVVFYAIFLFTILISFQSGFVNANPENTPHWTNVEEKFLLKSGRQTTYLNEYFPVIEVRNQYELGKLTALRFIEWLQYNPRAVIGFTSGGSTPEFFIKFLDYYKNHWNLPEVQAELKSHGIKLKKFPKTSDLKFVQIEEIYPMSDNHYKKLSNYSIRHYVKILEIKPENLLLMDMTKKGILSEKGMNVVFMNGKVDLALADRKATSQLEYWQQTAIKEVKEFCNDYEKKIRAWGGIDFFIGCLGYHGQLGFIESDSKEDIKTHIVKWNQRSAAHSAKDFGGIEYARGKIAITIGLGTLAFKPKAVMIIIAAGESKAAVVRDSIENKSTIQYPATLLQKFPNSRFYISSGAAKLLSDRQAEDLRLKCRRGCMPNQVDEVIIDVALAEKKSILSLTAEDFNRHARGRFLLENRPNELSAMLAETRSGIIKKIDAGVKLSFNKVNKILHTAPHHEDTMLGYYPLFNNLIYKYKNYFVYFTSGFNIVTDSYILSTLSAANDWWLDREKDIIFKKQYEKLLNKFEVYYHKKDFEQLKMIDTIFVMRYLVAIYNLKDLNELKHTVRWLKDDYFPSKQPGDLDVVQIKLLKGMMRESESERLLHLFHVSKQNITHLRSKFYSGREFMRTPNYEMDVTPFINIYNRIKPDLITVLDDPDSAPPITNYRVLQAIAQGLRSKNIIQNDNLQILGYRNIWFRYKVSDANIFVPITAEMMNSQKIAYNACFNTQKSLSFPSPFFDGDFAMLINIIEREQLAELKILLGEEYFSKNSIAEFKNAKGFIFLNKMKLNDLLRRAEDLKPYIELEKRYIANKKLY